MVTKIGNSLPLRKMLYKLGVKSAEPHFMEEIMQKTLHDFGRPDAMFVDGSVLENYLKLIGDSDAKIYNDAAAVICACDNCLHGRETSCTGRS